MRKLQALGFKILATGGTQRYLTAHGLKAEKVNKVSEGRPHAADAVRNGAVQLMFNTTEGATSLADSKPLRRAALLQKTPYYTTISGAIAAADGIRAVASWRARSQGVAGLSGVTAQKDAAAAVFFCTDRTMEKLPMTAAGHAALEAEFLRRQQVERPRIVAAIAEARSHGDLSENAEYHSAKEAQSHNEGRIVELEDLLQRAEVIDVTKLNGTTIKFGATVTLIDEDTEKQSVFQIVGESEADVKSGKVSITSPTGRALIGKKAGDSIEVNTPGGGKSYEIVKVAYI